MAIITTKKGVSEIWGKEFAPLFDDPRIKFTDENKIVLTFREPVKLISGETAREATIREPIVKDLLATDTAEGEAEKGVVLFSALAGILETDIKNMPLRDFNLIGKIMPCFLGDGPDSGRK